MPPNSPYEIIIINGCNCQNKHLKILLLAYFENIYCSLSLWGNVTLQLISYQWNGMLSRSLLIFPLSMLRLINCLGYLAVPLHPRIKHDVNFKKEKKNCFYLLTPPELNHIRSWVIVIIIFLRKWKINSYIFISSFFLPFTMY